MAKPFIISIVAISLFVCGTAQAMTYYVRQSGNDANHGKAAVQAFKTITKAATVAQAGDTVYVGAGTYTSKAEVTYDGTAANPIRFNADTTGAWTGDAGDVILSAKNSFLIKDDDYVQISGFVFDGQDEMVKLENSIGCLVQNCEFRNGKKPILAKNSRLTVHNCHIHHNDDSGIAIEGGVSTLTVTSCVITHSGGKGIMVKGSTQVVIEDTTCSDSGDHGVRLEADGCTAFIRRCVFQRNKDGFHSHGKHQLALENCLMTDNEEEGLQVHADAISVTLNHCTVVANGAPGIDCSKGVGWIRNSIVAFNLKEGLLGGGSYSSDYNLVYGNSSGNYKNLTPGTHDLVEDPKFYGSGNYRVKSSSPALDGGTGTMSVDLVGVGRPQGAAVDIGCYELDAGIYYVRISGDDSNLGTSPSQAFRTISRAAQAVVPGTVVHVGAGTYLESVTVQALGTSDEPIQFFADTTGAKTGDAGQVVVTPQVDQEFGWTLQNSAHVALDGFRISGLGMPQANGVFIDNADTVTLKNCEIDNTILGLNGVSSTITIQNCTIHDTATAGLWLYDINDADLQVSNLSLTNNGSYGLYVDSGDFAFDTSNINDWTISGCDIAIAGINTDFAFEGVTISGGTTAGVQLQQGNMNAHSATFSSSGDGLAIDSSNVSLTSCTFSGNSVGLYANSNSFLSVTNSTFTGNTLWGASVTPSGNSGETATFSGCTFSGNAGGLTLASATDGDVLLRDATVISDNTAAGLHFENCNLTVNDQAGGVNWSTLRNLYGISSNQSTLALSQINVQDSTSYGVRCQDSTVSLSECTVTGRYGVFADATNDSLVIEKSVLDSGASPGRGVIHYGGELNITNSILDGYWMGVHLYETGSGNPVSLLNTNITNTTGFAVYHRDGDAVVRNTILTGSSYGFVHAAGTLTHTHNLLHGFSQPFYLTTADATEVERDPQFVDAANGDFHLGVGSPAINAGMDLGSLVPTDMEGNSRPSYNGYEIGVYEYMSPNGSFRVLDWTEKR